MSAISSRNHKLLWHFNEVSRIDAVCHTHARTFQHQIHWQKFSPRHQNWCGLSDKRLHKLWCYLLSWRWGQTAFIWAHTFQTQTSRKKTSNPIEQRNELKCIPFNCKVKTNQLESWCAFWKEPVGPFHFPWHTRTHRVSSSSSSSASCSLWYSQLTVAVVSFMQ